MWSFLLQQQTQVPKFGNWENEDDVPYTQYFDNARKNKMGGKMNPNDPQDYINAEMKSEREPEATMPKQVRYNSRGNGEMIRSGDPDAMSQKSATGSPHQRQGGSKYGNNRSDLDAPRGADMQRPKHERRQSREDGDLRRSTDSPLRNEPTNRKTPHDSPHHQYAGMSAGDTPKRVGRQNVGSDRSIEHSPLHPRSQVRIGGRGSGVSSPSWERKGSIESGGQGMTPSTPGRSRLRSVTQDDETVMFFQIHVCILSHINVLVTFIMKCGSSLIIALLFQNLVIGMRMILHQQKDTVTYLTE